MADTLSRSTTAIATERALEGKSRPQVRKYKANVMTNYFLRGITEQRFLKKVNIGGALRWEDKGAIGFEGVQTAPAIITALNVNRPIYDQAHTYLDFNAAYRTRLFADRVAATFQLNARNVTEDGRLQTILANPDRSPRAFRIVDPRQFIFTVSFDL